eukprot:5036673-Lingulodinium_polyedra.AAC.1
MTTGQQINQTTINNVTRGRPHLSASEVDLEHHGLHGPNLSHKVELAADCVLLAACFMMDAHGFRLLVSADR